MKIKEKLARQKEVWNQMSTKEKIIAMSPTIMYFVGIGIGVACTKTCLDHIYNKNLGKYITSAFTTGCNCSDVMINTYGLNKTNAIVDIEKVIINSNTKEVMAAVINHPLSGPKTYFFKRLADGTIGVLQKQVRNKYSHYNGTEVLKNTWR